MGSDRTGELSGIGQAGQEIAVFNGCFLFDRPGGTDTAESLKPRPVFPAGEPCYVPIQPCFPLFNTSVILGNLGIFRFAKVILGK